VSAVLLCASVVRLTHTSAHRHHILTHSMHAGIDPLMVELICQRVAKAKQQATAALGAAQQQQPRTVPVLLQGSALAAALVGAAGAGAAAAAAALAGGGA